MTPRDKRVEGSSLARKNHKERLELGGDQRGCAKTDVGKKSTGGSEKQGREDGFSLFGGGREEGRQKQLRWGGKHKTLIGHGWGSRRPFLGAGTNS